MLTLSPIQSSCLALCLCFSLSASVRALSLARVLHSRLPIALVVGMVVDAQVQFLQRPFLFVFCFLRMCLVCVFVFVVVVRFLAGDGGSVCVYWGCGE